jgi:hypothetical protein
MGGGFGDDGIFEALRASPEPDGIRHMAFSEMNRAAAADREVRDIRRVPRPQEVLESKALRVVRG